MRANQTRQIPLSREAVVSAALELIDEEGLSAFTMRSLGEELNVTAMALYRHVTDRNDLLAAVSGRVLSEIELPPESLAWDEWLTEFAKEYRAALYRHPNVSPVLSMQLVSNSADDFPIVEAILSVLERAGFRGNELINVYNTYLGTIVGFVGVELSPPPMEEADAWYEKRKAEMASLDPKRFPRIYKHRQRLRHAFAIRWLTGSREPMDKAFEVATDVLINGLRSRLASH